MTSLAQALADLARGVVATVVQAVCAINDKRIMRFERDLNGDDDE